MVRKVILVLVLAALVLPVAVPVPVGGRVAGLWGPGAAWAEGDPFSPIADKIKEWLTGGLGKILLVLCLIGGGVAMMAGRWGAFFACLVMVAVILTIQKIFEALGG